MGEKIGNGVINETLPFHTRLSVSKTILKIIVIPSDKYIHVSSTWCKAYLVNILLISGMKPRLWLSKCWKYVSLMLKTRLAIYEHGRLHSCPRKFRGMVIVGVRAATIVLHFDSMRFDFFDSIHWSDEKQ